MLSCPAERPYQVGVLRMFLGGLIAHSFGVKAVDEQTVLWDWWILPKKVGVLEDWIKIQWRNYICDIELFSFLIESKYSTKEGKLKGAITYRE